MKNQTKVLLVMVGLVAFFFATFIHTQQAVVSRAELEPIMAIQDRHTKGLMKNPDVVGTAVGIDRTGRPTIKLYTSRSGVSGLPARLDGVRVSVEVVGTIEARKGGPGGGVDPTARFPRPVPIGVSTGHPAITAGTIGCRVMDGQGNVYALSNNHVYADINAASIGDAVIQPGTFDGGSSPADDIGNLAAFVPISFSGTNTIDAAIASTTTSLVGNSTPSDGYGTPGSTTTAAVPGNRVQKYGRTTGQTSGRIDAINATVNVSYGAPGVATFVGQIIVRPGNFSAGGDSGSLIVANGGPNNQDPVGLLFAGSSQVTIANPIDAVLSAFNVTVDGN